MVVDRAGHPAAAGSSPLTSSSPRPGGHEQDAGSWWTATDAAVRLALGQLSAEPARLAGADHVVDMHAYLVRS